MAIEVDPSRLAQIRRVNVVGTSGSGKSTFSRRLADALRLPHVEMDRLYRGPNWTDCPDPQFFEKVQAATREDEWVLDGNYTRTTAIKWERVQLVVWLDLPYWRTVWRVTGRSLSRALSGQELWPGTGNRETLAKAFLSRDSVILWAITTHGRHRREYARLMDEGDLGHIWFVRLRSPGEVEGFLQVAREAVSPAPSG
jgi:adenylate kinase family enzyme